MHGADGRASDGEVSSGGEQPLSARDALALDAAKLAHGRGLSQQRIAEALHVSRPQVSKLLATARAKGFVRTLVLDPRESDRTLTQGLRERFGLGDVRLVVPAGRGPADLDHALGVGAAEMLDAAGALEDAALAAWWSSAVRATLESALGRLRARPGSLVVLGGQGRADGPDPAFEAFAARTAFPVHRGPADSVHASLAARIAREEEADARAHEALVRAAGVLLFGAAAADPRALARPDLLTDAERAQIREHAVGRICGRFLDADGRIVAPTLSQRTAGPTLTDLRRRFRTVLVAGGAEQVGVIRAALARRYAHHLVTDLATARQLLADEV
ncbi:MarR family transcriptional regulator [Brachybacterium halotolerans subsp. kimchii]|uniref:sugar-binding domain-containing protein n=1 Tax=Brachybacterium halotolerans TaxID=2795215 RepID=UPI001E359DFB|nr:sugar-binding domain-containing protein [Brachybacterium halotolerans]UEJ82335.1 MarR family transcriptional regulator [Brachybacterium halotolerans subsp. kimchii]